MKKLLYHPTFLFIIRLALGLVFIYASMDKIANPEEFAKAINNYRMMPDWILNIMAIYLPWILFAGTFLVFGIYVRGSTLVINVLMVIFIIAISAALFRGIDIHCGCFSTEGGEKVGLLKLLEDFAYLAAGYWIYYTSLKTKTVAEAS
jgi:uncharacterized membrane protein YphA (DoxX/SURF4 family)